MKDFSKEIINIDGVDYTLFLNRKGIVAWEKISNAMKKTNEIEGHYKNGLPSQEDMEIKDGDNPFELAKQQKSQLEKDEEILIDMYIKFYWIMLYENHKLDLKDVKVLWEKAVQEYGIEQLIELGMQMLDDANRNKLENQNLKNLKALRPKKN